MLIINFYLNYFLFSFNQAFTLIMEPKESQNTKSDSQDNTQKFKLMMKKLKPRTHPHEVIYIPEGCEKYLTLIGDPKENKGQG
jgi:hypothetical protein